MKLALNVLIAVAVLGSLAACGRPAEKVQELPKQTAPAVADPGYPKELMLDAMLRGHPKSKKVCIDETRDRAFFIDYSQREEIPENGIFAGSWLFIENVEFYQTSNKTLFITNQDEKKYIAVYPDITNLSCKDR